MKLKNFLLVLAGGMLAACSGSDDVTSGGGPITDPTVPETIPETQLFAGITNDKAENGGLVSVSAATRATETTSILPNAITTKAYFSIRVDGYLNQSNTAGSAIDMNKDYYPLPATGSVPQLENNTGYVYTQYPTLPATEAQYKADRSKQMEAYVFSTDGSATGNIIIKAPTMEQVLAARVTEAQPLINLDYTKMPADVDKDNLHIIWYVVKKISIGDKLWHVDGVLTDKKDIREVMRRTPAMDFWEVKVDANDNTGLENDIFDKDNVTYSMPEGVEVDVHQQEHQDWGEIKTSIHIKTAEDVKVTIPVSEKLLVDNPDLLNDVRVRTFEMPVELENLNAKYSTNVACKVERDANGVYISVTGMTPIVLKAIEDQYADGLIFEIHTFTSFKDINTVWIQMAGTKVDSKAKVSGQVTSAYKPYATARLEFDEDGNAVYGGFD